MITESLAAWYRSRIIPCQNSYCIRLKNHDQKIYEEIIYGINQKIQEINWCQEKQVSFQKYLLQFNKEFFSHTLKTPSFRSKVIIIQNMILEYSKIVSFQNLVHPKSPSSLEFVLGE